MYDGWLEIVGLLEGWDGIMGDTCGYETIPACGDG